MSYDEADDMCPNCVTPWKCNGPHLHEQTKAYWDNPPDPTPSPALTREALALALLKVTQEQPGLLAEADRETVERVDAAAWAIFEALGTTEEERA